MNEKNKKKNVEKFGNSRSNKVLRPIQINRIDNAVQCNAHLDTHWGKSSAEIGLVLKRSARHSVEVFDVNQFAADLVAAVTAAEVVAVELPHSLGAAAFAIAVAFALPNRFVAVDLSSASRDPLINCLRCLLLEGKREIF